MIEADRPPDVADRAERAILAHIRHELRTPINGIIGYAEMLLEDVGRTGSPELLSDLQRIHAAGRELLALVGDLLDPARVETRAGVDLEALGANVRHALRTPISAVLGYCELLLEDASEGADDAFVSDVLKIRTAAEKLLGFLEDIVKTSAGETRDTSVRAASPVSTMVRAAVSAMRPLEKGTAKPPAVGGSVLIVDDNQIDRDLLARRLQRESYTVSVAENGRLGLEAIEKLRPDLVLLDVIMPEMNGYQVLERLKTDRELRHVPVIMLSSWDEADSVVRCLELGAEDYLSKPVNLAVLLARIGNSIEKKRQRDREISYLRGLENEKSGRYGELVGKHPTIKEVQRQIDREARAATPLLLEGERGTGRELVARLVHARGRGKDTPLLSVDCAQVAETPWGDKLFGEARSGETGPRGVHYMDLVEGGTILLRNIDSLPSGVQERLARFLDKDSWIPGQARQDVRVIATTSGRLAELVSAGRINPGLVAMLLAHVIALPPLRDRKRDIPELVSAFVRKHAARLNKPVQAVDDQALVRLVTYDYRLANVKELEEAIERAVILAGGDTITAEEVFLGLPLDRPSRGVNLLDLPRPLVGLGLRLFPGIVRGLVAAIFLFILYQCLLAPPDRNLGTLLVWSVWWPGLVVSLAVAGRVWCAVCPMAFAGAAAQKAARRERRIPRWLKDHDTTIVMAGFFAIVWAEEAAGMRYAPRATGYLLLTILAGAVVTSVLFPRRTWCRHICPLGGFAGLCSTTAVMELRPTLDVCTAKCKGHSCYTGSEKTAGCPMFQHVMFVDSNQHCVMCLNCVRNCPNGSPQVKLRLPAGELAANLRARPEAGRFVMLLFGLLVGQMLLQRWEHPSTAGGMAALMAQQRFLVVTLTLVICAAVPLLLVELANRLVPKSQEPGLQVWQKVAAGVPLVTAAVICFQLGFVPLLDSFQTTVGYVGASGVAESWLGFSLLTAARTAVLATGFVLTFLVVWSLRLAEKQSGGRVA
ncbi:MAG: response regulator [Acidobacteria bacterium]|nr:response regulator [Acidobacteriota bacterium]